MKKGLRFKLYIFLVTTFLFGLQQHVFGIFTIESSQNALLLLKDANQKTIEALKYMLFSVKDSKVIFYEQAEVWFEFEKHLRKIPEEVAEIILKIKTLEKENENYELLLNKLFILLNNMDKGIEMYSDYMKVFDSKVKILLERQKNSLEGVSEYMKFCD